MDEGVELGIDHAQRPIGRTLAAGTGEIAPDQCGAFELEAVDVRACRVGSDPDKGFVDPVAIGIDADRSGDLHVLVIAEEPGEADVEPVVEQRGLPRSEEHTSEPQSLMRISYAVFCLKKK